MLAIIFLGICIAILVAFALVLLTFLDVVLAEPTEQLSSSRQWQPPLMRGNDLRSWAAEMASAATNKWLTQPRDKDTAFAIASEVYQGASNAIAHSQNVVQQISPNCPSCRQKMIGVTPPEALLIAEAVRKNLSNKKARQIYAQSKVNAKRVANFDPQQYEKSEVTCPLWDGESYCMVFRTRPLQCRGWCSDTSCKSRDRSAETHAHTVGIGAEDGLSKSLQNSGLDGTVYELNSALAAALDASIASEEWVRGNSVFENCKRYA